MEKQEFFPDDGWMEGNFPPKDLENRYALSFTLCNGKSVRAKDNQNSKKGGTKGDQLQNTFYEVHGNKFYRDAINGSLQAKHFFCPNTMIWNRRRMSWARIFPRPTTKCASPSKNSWRRITSPVSRNHQILIKGLSSSKSNSSCAEEWHPPKKP